MFSLRRRKDSFRLLLPKEFIPAEINEKYTRILKDAKSFYTRPIDFLNESIQKVEVFGFNGGTVQQQQSSRGVPLRDPRRVQENNFMHMAADVNYRNPDSILKLLDRTLNIEFRHTLSHLNYFLLLESFIYQYSRDTKANPDLDYEFKIEILNENGAIYSNIVLFQPLIDALDMLTFDNTSTVAQTESFKCVFKYNNFDYQFINCDANTAQIDFDKYLDEVQQDHPWIIPGQPQIKNSNRIPKLKTTSPTDTVPGDIPYFDNDDETGDGQIIYEDEGGVLKDILHHDRKDTPGTITDDSTGKIKEKDPGSFVDIMASGKMEYNDGLAENEKFLYYPYEKDYENKKRKMSTFEISTGLDKSMTKVNENGEDSPEYPDRSEYKNWEDVDFQKFRNNK